MDLNVFKDYVVPAFAIIGVAQTWAIRAVNRFLLRPKVEIFKSGLLEIGYSTFGPTIGIVGTLRITGRDAFVAGFRATVTSTDNATQHNLNWVASRPSDIDGASSSELIFRTPLSFDVKARQPHPYSIVFHDAAANSQVTGIFRDLQVSWHQLVLDAKGRMSVDDFLRDSLNDCERVFREQAHVLDAYEKLRDLCYWTPGKHRLQIHVDLADPSTTISFAFEFEMTEADIAKLKLNAVNLLQSPVDIAVGRKSPPYNTAVLPYTMTKGE